MALYDSAQAADSLSTGQITTIELRLFNARTGEFRRGDVKDGVYAGWNDFSDEGNGGRGRGDALVIVSIEANTQSGYYRTVGSPLTITARSKGKVVAQRRFKDINVFNGRASRALYLQDIGCAGDIIVEAQLERQRRSVRMAMACGE